MSKGDTFREFIKRFNAKNMANSTMASQSNTTVCGTNTITVNTIGPSNGYLIGGGSGGASSYGVTTKSIMDGKISATDIDLNGVSLKDSIEKINERLNILTPKPELLAKYETLKDLYSQYKMMEALLIEESKPK